MMGRKEYEEGLDRLIVRSCKTLGGRAMAAPRGSRVFTEAVAENRSSRSFTLSCYHRKDITATQNKLQKPPSSFLKVYK